MHKQVTCIKCGEWTFDSGDWCVFCGPCEGSYTHRLKWLIPGIIFMLFLAGCAAQSTRSFVIDGVGQDLYIRDIGGNNQQAGTSRQDADVDPGIAGKGFPHLILGGNSLAGSDHIEIRNVEGSVVIDRALGGNQGIDLPLALEKLFTPGNPFEERRR